MMNNSKNIQYSFQVTVVFDNHCAENGFKMGFGFAALIHNHFTRNNILFDTGGNGKTLSYNIKKLGLDLSSISSVIISHSHLDHAGGLDIVINSNPEVKVYVPMTSSAVFNQKFPESDIIPVDGLMEVEKNVMTSGQFGTSFSEQCAFLRTRDEDLILIVGCTHPGLEKFIVRAREFASIRAIIGGFHGFRKFSYLEGIPFIGACHCTQYGAQIKKKLPNSFKEVCVGSTFSF